MKVNRNALCKLIPHTGSMCLLDSVESWDEQRIICIAHSHLSSDNPLRYMGQLSVIHVLEYGAQAMAVHGSLSAQAVGERIRGGYIAAVRDARFHIERLDLLEQPLTLEATRLISSGENQIYRIRVSAARQPIAEARLMVINSMGADG